MTTKRPDETFSDTTILNYDANLSKFNFSFSKYAEGKKGIKLSGCRLVFRRHPENSNMYTQLPKEFSFKVDEVPTTDEKLLAVLIERYKKDMK